VKRAPTKRELQAAFEAWHWGSKAEKVVDFPGYPEMVECGRLVQLRFRVPGSTAKKDSSIMFTRAAAVNSHVAYGYTSPHQLYLILERGAQKDMKRLFWDGSQQYAQNLTGLARRVGGRHGSDPYPQRAGLLLGCRGLEVVKPIGVLTDTLYSTLKNPDGPRAYRHPMGEISGVAPLLCVDGTGCLWVAGGDYKAENLAGIKN
jgi:hypothetical protein